MKRHIFLFTLIAGLLHGCSTSGPQAGNEIRVEVSQLDKTFPLSRLYDRYEIIPLGSTDDVLIHRIDNLVPFDGRYYVGDNQVGTVFVFDQKGKYLHSVGRQGRGPGEYNGLSDFTIGRDSVLYLLSNSPSKISRYWPDGTFLDEFEVPLAMNLAMDDRFIYLYADGRHFQGEREWAGQLYILDKTGNEIDRALPLNEVRSYPFPMKYNQSRPFSCTEDGLLFSMLLDNTIYRLKNGEVVPAYSLDYGTFTIPDSFFAGNRDPNDFIRNLSKARYAKNLHYVYETAGSLVFSIDIDNRYYRLMNREGELYELRDDLLEIDPILFVMNEKEYIGVLNIDALLFRFENGEYAGLKEKLDSMEFRVDENSNPLLIRYWD